MGEMNKDKRIVLVVGMGASPAVLTETVWALAHQEESIVPDEIVVLTTKFGKNALLSSIMSGETSVWSRFKNTLAKEGIAIGGKLIFGETSIRVIPDAEGNEINDLRTGSDNLRAADFMLGELRKYTADTSTTVLCSIAGGRKTMSALLFSCMTLLGREDDKVYHVLIPPEYECGMDPPFFFPEKGKKHKVFVYGRKDGKMVASAKINIELFEVPFVRMRGWYQDKFKYNPPSYKTLITKVQNIAPPAVVYPEIEIDVWNGCVKVNGIDVHIGVVEFAALLILASGVSKAEEIYERLYKLKHQTKTLCCDWVERFTQTPKFYEAYEQGNKENNQEVSKVISQLRKGIEKSGAPKIDSLITFRFRKVTFPIENIQWKGKDKLMDICGYLFANNKS